MTKKTRKIVVAFIGIILFLCFAILSHNSNALAFDFVGSAQSMIVLERNSGRVLNEKNADMRLPMASTTKIATAITVMENIDDLEKVIVVPKLAVGVEGSSIYLQENEEIKVIDLLYGLMLQSGNDCAVALALTVAGSIDKFADLMNETAIKAGAENTNFVNPHGLHDDNHYTTARDLAKITAYAMNNATFKEIVSTKKRVVKNDIASKDRVIINKNKILTTYDGGDGVKTGFTKKAGRCLVASSTRNDMNVIAVVLNCGPMFEDCRRLMDDAYDRYKMTDVNTLIDGECCIEIKNAFNKKVRAMVVENRSYPLLKSEIENIKYEISVDDNLKAPIKECSKIGKIKFFIENELLFERKLYTIERVESLSIHDELKEIVDNWNN